MNHLGTTLHMSGSPSKPIHQSHETSFRGAEGGLLLANPMFNYKKIKKTNQKGPTYCNLPGRPRVLKEKKESLAELSIAVKLLHIQCCFFQYFRFSGGIEKYPPNFASPNKLSIVLLRPRSGHQTMLLLSCVMHCFKWINLNDELKKSPADCHLPQTKVLECPPTAMAAFNQQLPYIVCTCLARCLYSRMPYKLNIAITLEPHTACRIAGAGGCVMKCN